MRENSKWNKNNWSQVMEKTEEVKVYTDDKTGGTKDKNGNYGKRRWTRKKIK